MKGHDRWLVALGITALVVLVWFWPSLAAMGKTGRFRDWAPEQDAGTALVVETSTYRFWLGLGADHHGLVATAIPPDHVQAYEFWLYEEQDDQPGLNGEPVTDHRSVRLATPMDELQTDAGGGFASGCHVQAEASWRGGTLVRAVVGGPPALGLVTGDWQLLAALPAAGLVVEARFTATALEVRRRGATTAATPPSIGGTLTAFGVATPFGQATDGSWTAALDLGLLRAGIAAVHRTHANVQVRVLPEQDHRTDVEFR